MKTKYIYIFQEFSWSLGLDRKVKKVKRSLLETKFIYIFQESSWSLGLDRKVKKVKRSLLETKALHNKEPDFKLLSLWLILKKKWRLKEGLNVQIAG